MDRHTDYPGFDPPLLNPEHVAGKATLNVDALMGAVHAVRTRRVRGHDDRPDTLTFAFHKDEVVLSRYEPRVGRIDFRVAAPGAWATVEVEVSADDLINVLSAVRPSDQVTISLSQYNVDPIALESDEWFGFVMPFRTANAKVAVSVRELLREMFGPVAVNTDADGDYPLQLINNPVYGRFHTDEDQTLWVQVFAVVVDDIAASPEVYAELNEQNANGRFVRLFHVEKQILAEVDLLASTLERVELQEAIDRITTMTEEIMPTLTAVLGGHVPGDSLAYRWQTYRTSILEAEILPGQRVHLNGSDGIEDFPFPERCFVITDWNPMGTTRTLEANRDMNDHIAHDVIDHGGRFVYSIGRSPDGDHVEESLFVWGVDREIIRDLGTRARQDAIFELDADTIKLVSCVDDRIESWPRRG